MAELITRLGIEWHILLVQVVNFGILLFVLHRFAYKPILKVMNDRVVRITEDEQKASDLEEKLTAIEREQQQILQNARTESQRLIKEGEIDAKEVGSRILADARVEASHIIHAAAATLAKDRIKLVEEVKAEMGMLISAAIEKTVAGAVDANAQQALVKEALTLIRTGDTKPHATKHSA